jgi:hypothetical protein
MPVINLMPTGGRERFMSRSEGRGFAVPLTLIVVGLALVGLYALVRQPAAIGLGLILLCGYVSGGTGIVLLLVQVFSRKR